jgi:ketosteroid isomerase-like protein
MTESPARAAADRYIAAINAGDVDALRAVFDHDATLVHPSGTYEGVDAILAFYRNIVLAFETQIHATSFADKGDRCIVEMEGRTPHAERTQAAADVFTVGPAGQVTHLRITYR